MSHNGTSTEAVLEAVENDFDGQEPTASESTPVNTEFNQESAESAEDLADHGDVSSSEAAADTSDGDTDAPSTGTETGGGEASESGLELEAVAGFDESILEMDSEAMAESLDSDESLLDAYHAEFSDEATQALMRTQGATLIESTAEVVIGKDDRIRVQATRKYPWRAICSLRITARDGSHWIGTGWLVGPRTVITAGHVVFMRKHGGWAKKIEVIPGRNGSSKPYGSCIATSFRSVKGWTKKGKRSHDYGAILLPKSCPFGKRVGYFGYANYSFSSLLGRVVNLSGYPGDKPSGTQWWHARRIKFVTGRRLLYNIDTYGGQSGSPVWRYVNGHRYAVGIHTSGSLSGNGATRISKPVFKNIKKWKQQGL